MGLSGTKHRDSARNGVDREGVVESRNHASHKYGSKDQHGGEYDTTSGRPESEETTNHGEDKTNQLAFA